MDSASLPVRIAFWEFHGTASRVQRAASRFFLLSLVVAFALALLPSRMLGGVGFGVSGLFSLTALLSLLTVGLGWLVGSFRWTRRAERLQVQGQSLVFEQGAQRSTWTLATFRTAWSAGSSLTFETMGGDELHVGMASADDARRVLRAAGLDARHRRASFVLGSAWLWTLLLYTGGPLVSLAAAIQLTNWSLRGVEMAPDVVLLVGASLCLALWLILRGIVQAYLSPSRLTIGSDGVEIDHRLHTIFLPFTDIRDWVIDEEGVTFRLRSGGAAQARAMQSFLGFTATAVQERLADAHQIHRTTPSSDELREALRRGGRPLPAWRRELASLTERAGYRQGGAFTPDELLGVVGSAHEPDEVRLGAALALRAKGVDGLPQRLRVTAEACANPRLRVALAQIADGETDDALLDDLLVEQRERA